MKKAAVFILEWVQRCRRYSLLLVVAIVLEAGLELALPFYVPRGINWVIIIGLAVLMERALGARRRRRALDRAREDSPEPWELP